MVFKRNILIPLLLSIFCYTSFAQNISGYKGEAFAGYILPHHKEIAYYVHKPVYGASIQLLHQASGEAYWHHLYNQPKWGVGASFSSLSNSNVYGYAYSFYGLFDNHIIRRNNWRLMGSMHFGMSYISNPFNLETNYWNYAISSRLNIIFNLGIEAGIRLTDRLWLTSFWSLGHYSNGKVTAPNKGLNAITASVGLEQYIKESSYSGEVPDMPALNKNELAFFIAMGTKQLNLLTDKRFYAGSFAVDYYRHYSHKGKWGLGTDLFYDESLKTLARNTGVENPGDIYYYRLGAHIGHAWKVGDVALLLQIGHYFFKKITITGSLYNRVGLKYHFTDIMAASLTLKSHKGIADFIEFGIDTKLTFN